MTKLLHFLLLVLLLAPIVFADETKEDPDALSPECQEILAELEADQKQHKADYKAKGKAYYNWKKYHDELNSDSYLNTDAPLMDSVKKCKSDRNPDSEKKLDKDFCKGVMKKYEEISPKEESTKKSLVEAQKKSDESKKAYNTKLREAADKKCIMRSRKK